MSGRLFDDDEAAELDAIADDEYRDWQAQGGEEE